MTDRDADPLDYADARHFILTVGSYTAQTGKEAQVHRAVLPVPNWLQSAWTFPACSAFARSVRREGGDVWLVANESPDLGFHFRGLMVTKLAPVYLADGWAERTGADAKTAQIEPIGTATVEPFETSLARTVMWSCEQAGPRLVHTDDRVVAVGKFRDLWRDVAER